MNKKFSWLMALLVVQVVIATGLFIWGNSNAGRNVSVALFDFDSKAVDKLVISDGKSEASIQKKGSTWILPTMDGLSASDSQVELLLDQMLNLKTNWPVASTTSSHQRFEVAKDHFKHKITVYKGDKAVATLFVGSSPGFKKANVRKEGDDNVYALELNAYDLKVNAKDWLDKTLLAINNITDIKARDFELKFDNNSWAFVNMGKDEHLDQQKAKTLSQKFSSLQVSALVENPPAFDDKAVISFDVSGDSQYKLQFYATKDNYYVKRSDIDKVFSLNKSTYEPLTSAKRTSLLASDDDKKGDDTKAVDNKSTK